jgi:hypothetical protein
MPDMNTSTMSEETQSDEPSLEERAFLAAVFGVHDVFPDSQSTAVNG